MTPTDSKPLRACPKCGAAITANALNGLCPNCLVMVTFDQGSAVTVTKSDPPLTEAAAMQTQARPLLSSSIRYFGDYELLEEIARGGMGVVWKARQVSLNRVVAVKMILTGKFASDADVKRFRTEAEAAATLQHPNIVAIHEVGLHEGQHYFSMDLIEGKSLSQLVVDEAMPAAKAATLVKTISEAVHYAHQRGTLHRDLKPSNVLIDAAGQPRITDFGLAKRVEKESGLTQTGAAMGSPSYMPPEQAAGRHGEVGPASDVYSLGAILFQLLTGRAPFVAETALATMRKVMEEEPITPSKLNPLAPPDLETICLKCLEKKPERRYATARALAEELDRFLNHEPILAKPASAWRKCWTWSTRNPWAIIGAAAMAGIVLLGFAYGLWERVKYLEGKTTPQFYYRPMKVVGLVATFTGYLVLIPGILFGRWLKGRRQRNLPVSNFQLALLAGSGLLLIAIGLWSDMEFIRLYVWKKPFIDSLPALAAFCLGLPLLFCWVGGILIWQAIRRQQAHWSGLTTAEEDWLPRQSHHYSTVVFLASTLAIVAFYVSVAYLGIATGLFNDFLAVIGDTGTGKTMLLTSFPLIALGVSTACWVYATRKVYKRPPLVSVFLGVLFVGAMIGWFSAPPYSLLPANFVLTAMLAGVVGGCVLVKCVKIRKEAPAETVAPLALDELFQWDRRAFAITLAVVGIALGLPAGLFLRLGDVPFLLFTVLNALWPALFLAVRATTGKVREFFLSMMVVLTICSIVAPLGALGLPVLLHDQAGKSTVILHWLAIILIGNAAGCALIYFGKIRPKAR